MSTNSTKTVKGRISNKHGTEAEWLQADAAGFKPLPGELIIYDPDDSHDYFRFKFGDKDPDESNRRTVDKLPFVVNEYLTKALLELDTTNKTIVGAINELNDEKIPSLTYATEPSTSILEIFENIRERGLVGKWVVVNFTGYQDGVYGLGLGWYGGSIYGLYGLDLRSGGFASNTNDWSGLSILDFKNSFTRPLYGVDLATVATSGSYNDLADTPTIPTKTSWNYDDTYVKYSAAQSLTDTQKSQARANIGAGTSSLTLGTSGTTAAKGNHDHNSSYLPKLTYEWNKSYNAGQTAGYLLIGSFPMYDSNLTIDIDSTTTVTYHGTLVIATQNVSETSIGSDHTITVYGDPTGTISDAIRVVWNSGSRNYNVYFVPTTWSKNLIHIRALGNYLENIDESKICTQFTAGTAPTTTTGLTVVNALKNAFAPKANYAGSSSAGGAATSALKLSNTAKIGDTNKPVYFKADGTPAAIDYTIDASVPSGAKFTDTNNNQTIKGNGTSFGADDVINIVGGGNVSVAADTANKKITISYSTPTNNVTVDSGLQGQLAYFKENANPSKTIGGSSKIVVMNDEVVRAPAYQIAGELSNAIPPYGNSATLVYDTGKKAVKFVFN